MRSISLTQGPSQDMLEQPKKLPTVFKWERGGKQVYISGSYDGWKSKTPLSKRLVFHKTYDVINTISNNALIKSISRNGNVLIAKTIPLHNQV